MKICTILLVLIGVCSFLCCKTQAKVFDQNVSRYYEYSERDLNMLIAMDFIRQKHNDCGEERCRIAVRGLFMSYNRCFENQLPTIVERTKYNFDKVIEVAQSISLEGWGTISFMGTVMQDYNFSPVLVDQLNGKIYGSVYYKYYGLDRFENFSFDVVGDNLYYSGTGYVHDGSCRE